MEEQSNVGNKAIGIILTILAILLVIAGVWYWFFYKPAEEAKEKARQEQLAKEAAEKKRKEAAAKNKAKYDELIANGNREYDSEYWETAKSSYSEASRLFPNEPYPQDRLNLVNLKLDSLAAANYKPDVGAIESITSSTGKFYVVVSSSVDGDLAMDYAKKLSKEGNNVKIIEPYGNSRFYRVSLGDYNSVEEAASATSSYSSIDGDAVWVLNY